MSASIRPRLEPYSITRIDVETSDESMQPSYVVMQNGVEQRVSAFPDTMRSRFSDRIVVVGEGLSFERQELFGWREPYAWTQARIIHQTLRNVSTIPLDGWTPAIVTAVLLLSILCMFYLKPMLASVLIFLFSVVGQLWIDRYLLSHFGLILEVVPPMLAGLWSIPFFLLVRVMHERRQLDVDEKERIVQELKSAHDMQMGLLPSEDPKIPGYEISGICKPADEVGGDFFDYVWLDERKTRLGIAIGDVSGKAMKAAITAVLTSGMVYREVGTNETPKSILRKINRPMYLKTERRMFTAMMFAVIDVRKRKLTFSNAGQMQPMLKRRGTIQLLNVDGVRLPLGMMEDVDYHEVSMPLRPKDVVVFCTDGIPEAMNAKNEMFGFERLEEVVKESPGSLTAKQIAAKIADKVTEFTGSTKQNDDMTVVVLKIL
jgi:serine phosphatase RsbU (regulator of sigma subunit)